jgi:enterochelin esterase-like enzyme
LAQHPYRDLVVVMPDLPDVLKRDDVFRNGPVLADFVVNELVPRVRREFPEVGTEAFGIDGVSLGGRAALVIGFTHPKAFSTVGALQPAIDDSELDRFTKLAGKAVRENQGLSIRLVTSHEDYYREVVMAFASELNAAKVPHDFELVSGDHSYEFNRGPGAIEMLRFHAEALRR